MKINIKRNISTPVYKQIYHEIKEKILHEELVEGIKLSSERKLANELGVHRNTVIKAYDILTADGLITPSVSPRGYFVTYKAHGFSNNANIKLKPRYSNTLHYMLKDDYLILNNLFYTLYHGELSNRDDMVSFAADITYPSEELKKHMDKILEDIIHNPSYDIYGVLPPQGSLDLRKSIVRILEHKSIFISPKEIQVISETYEAIQLIIKLFLTKDDTILVEEPISPDMFENFQLMNINVITIPMDQDGMQTQYLEGLIEQYHPKMIYTIPTFHYPTGSTMSLQRRYELLDISYRYDIPIIEEDCDSSIRYEGNHIPSLKSLDKVGNVIYVSSFSVNVFPGIRLAYMVGPQSVIKGASRIVENTQMFMSPIHQFLVSELIKRGYFYKNINDLISLGRQKRDLLCEELDNVPDVNFLYNKPEGGTSLWCTIEEDLNPNVLLQNAKKTGVTYMPGELFFPFMDSGYNHIRLCFGEIDNDKIHEGVSRIAEAIRMTR